MSPALLLLFLMGSPARAKNAPALVLPEGVSAQWAISPSTRAGQGAEASFAVDPKGAVWLGVGEGAAFAPERNVLFQADRPFEQLVWMGDLELARSGEVLGVFEASKEPAKGMPKVHLKPLTTIPLRAWRLAAAGKKNVVVAGYNPRKKVSQVALLGPAADDRNLKVLHETQAQISDVASDGESTYVAAGGAIWKLGRPGQPARVYYAHPKRAVRRIALAPGGGLFYAAAEGVGYAGEASQLFFLRGARCQLAVSGDALYVLMGKPSGGVLRLRGIEAFARAQP